MSEAISCLIQHERGLAKLYKVYSQKFKNAEKFYGGLATQEERHAEFLETIYREVQSGRAIVSTGKANATAIESSLSYVQGQITRAETEDMTLLQAMAISNSIEGALIEARIGEMVNTDKPELQVLIDQIIEETKGHAAKIARALELEKGRN